MKGNNKKMRFLIILVVILLPVLSYAAKWEGYYITMEGDTVHAIFKIKTELGSSNPSYAKLQEGIKCKTEKSNPYFILNASIASKLVLKVGNSYEEFVAAREDSLLKSAHFYDNILIHRIIQGPVTLYCYYYHSYSTYATGSGSPSTSGTYTASVHNKKYILIKDDGNYLKVDSGGKRKYLIEFFKEYEELTQKIENKEIKTNEIEQIVNEYNAWRNESVEAGKDGD